MHHPLYRFLMLPIAALALAACTRQDPGPLAGSWRTMGPQRTSIQFRSGEVEADGVVDRVTYEHEGKDVLVTYTTGALKGKTMRFTMTGINTANSELGAMSRRGR